MSRIHVLLANLLCLLLPAPFREEYAREMMLLLRDELGERHGEFWSAVAVWLRLLPDLVETAFRAHGDLLAADARAWLRLVCQRRLFAAGMIGNFAASIALASAMFSVTYALLLRSLPYAEPDRLVNIENFPTVIAQSKPGEVREWLKTQNVFEDLAHYSPWQGNLDNDDSEPMRVNGAEVAPSFFQVFRQSVLMGSPLDASAGGYVVLSHVVWRAQFGSDPAVVGKTVRLNGQEFRVRGVMRPGFQFPESTQVWTSLPEQAFFNLMEEQQAFFTNVVGRLQAGASYQQAAAAAHALSIVLVGEEAKKYEKSAVPLQRALTAPIRQPVWFLTIAAGLLLLLGCASATGLMAARNAERANEVAIRFALGAKGSRIRRQAIMEGLLFALAGGVLGAAGAWALVRLIPAIVLPPGLADVPVDRGVLGAGLLCAVVAGVVSGWAAGWNASSRYQASPFRMLTQSWTNTAVSPERFRRMLLAGQIALAVALLVWAGLQWKSIYKLSHTDLGFDVQRLAAATVSLKGSPYTEPAARRELIARWQRRIEASIPGSRAAAVSALPMRMDVRAVLNFRFDDAAASTEVKSWFRTVSAGYVAASGGRIVAGNDFGPHDARSPEGAVLVNETFARLAGLSPGEIVGRRLKSQRQSDGTLRIAGVYSRESAFGPGLDAGAEISYFLDQRAPGYLSLLVRVQGDPAAAVDALRRAIREESRQVAVFDVRPMRDYLADRIADHRLYRLVLGSFAALSALTSLAGLVSLALFYVSTRRRELGIRMALGATGPRLVMLVVRHALPMLVGGALAGEALALAGSKGIASLLVNVEPLDVPVHGAICAAMLVVGFVAVLVAGANAAKIDPRAAIAAE